MLGCSFYFIFRLIGSLLSSVMDMLLMGENVFFNLAITRCASPFGCSTFMDFVRHPTAFYLISACCRYTIAKSFTVIALYYALPWSLLWSIMSGSSYLVGETALLLNALVNFFTLANARNLLYHMMYLALSPTLNSGTPIILLVPVF